MIKLSTINQIVESILDEGYRRAYKENNDRISQNILDNACSVANEAVIHYKTVMICEEKGIDEAMKYFTGTHSENEYQEFRTGVVADDFEEEWGFAPDSDYEIRKCNINETV